MTGSRVVSRRLVAGGLLALLALVASAVGSVRWPEVAVSGPQPVTPLSRGAGAVCIPHWRAVATPPLPDGSLQGVAAGSARDVWAVGYQRSVQAQPLVNTQEKPLIEHWDGKTWAVVASPDMEGSIADVVSVSAGDAWAVGSAPDPAASDRSTALIEHWDGQAWTVVQNTFQESLNAVAATSSRDVWAVGGNESRALVTHWDGRAWKEMASLPNDTWLNDVLAITSRNVWAVGWTGDTMLAMHWNGVRWHSYRLSPPAPEDAYGREITAIAAASANDLWTVGLAGSSGNAGEDYPFALRWQGSRWRNLPNPPIPDPVAIVARTRSDIWISGYANAEWYYDGSGGYLAHWSTSKNHWQEAPLPKHQGLNALVADTKGDLWAVGLTRLDSGANSWPIDENGDYIDGFQSTPLIEKYAC